MAAISTPKISKSSSALETRAFDIDHGDGGRFVATMIAKAGEYLH